VFDIELNFHDGQQESLLATSEVVVNGEARSTENKTPAVFGQDLGLFIGTLFKFY
jgi:hypothetical protein